MVRRPEKQLTALQADLDPDGSHGTRKIWAALTSTGIEPEDIEAGFVEKGPGLHPKVPLDRTEDISQQRRDIRTGLRLARIQQVRDALEAMDDDDVRRFERASVKGPPRIGKGPGIRPLVPNDVPPADAIDGVAEFKAIQAMQMERVQKDQERKANAICTEFLMGKKRADEADQRVADLNKRLKEYKAKQEEEWRVKKLESQKASDRRAAAVARAAQERAEYENEVERKLDERLNGARDRRAHHYSTENLSTKIESANAKREAAFQSALEQEERTLNEIMHKQAATEERLYMRKCEVADMMEQRRQQAQADFLNKQAKVEATKQEWAEEMLAKHKQFMEQFKKARDTGNRQLTERSKSTGDIAKKRKDKWKGNYDRLQHESDERNHEILERNAAATHRVEFEHKPMKWKCGGDVFSHLEVKDKTFGDLQQRRWEELQKARDAKTMAMCIKIAERAAKDEAVKAAQAELARKRVEAKKEILRYSNEANAVFLKIKSEPNEARIRHAMLGLGFKMPKLPGEDDDEIPAS